MCGGSIADSSNEYVNTCPIDGLITYLVYSMALVKGFSDNILEKLPIILKIPQASPTGNSVKGQIVWYENQLKRIL